MEKKYILNKWVLTKNMILWQNIGHDLLSKARESIYSRSTCQILHTQINTLTLKYRMVEEIMWFYQILSKLRSTLTSTDKTCSIVNNVGRVLVKKGAHASFKENWHNKQLRYLWHIQGPLLERKRTWRHRWVQKKQMARDC